MTQETRRYHPTEKAGPFIAGRKTPTKTVPTSAQVDGQSVTVKKVTVDTAAMIELTEEAARYELTAGTIVPVAEGTVATASSEGGGADAAKSVRPRRS